MPATMQVIYDETETESHTEERSAYVIAGDPATPLAQLVWFVRWSDADLRARVAENPALPVMLLSELAGDDSSKVRMAVAENPVTPIAVLEMLAGDDDSDIRYAIAENANTPPHILSMLCQDQNPYVVHRSEETIRRLAGSEQGADNLYVLNANVWSRVRRKRVAN